MKTFLMIIVLSGLCYSSTDTGGGILSDGPNPIDYSKLPTLTTSQALVVEEWCLENTFRLKKILKKSLKSHNKGKPQEAIRILFNGYLEVLGSEGNLQGSLTLRSLKRGLFLFKLLDTGNQQRSEREKIVSFRVIAEFTQFIVDEIIPMDQVYYPFSGNRDSNYYTSLSSRLESFVRSQLHWYLANNTGSSNFDGQVLYYSKLDSLVFFELLHQLLSWSVLDLTDSLNLPSLACLIQQIETFQEEIREAVAEFEEDDAQEVENEIIRSALLLLAKINQSSCR